MAGHHWTPEAPANDFLVPVREGGVLRDYQETTRRSTIGFRQTGVGRGRRGKKRSQWGRRDTAQVKGKSLAGLLRRRYHPRGARTTFHLFAKRR